MKTANSALPELTRSRRSVADRYLLRALCRSLFALAIFSSLLWLNACTSNTEKTEESKPAPKTTDLLTARSAFQKLYIAARGWNADSKPYRIQSSVTSDGNGRDGKAAIWRGSFASASARSEKTYTWSGSTADGAPEQGVNPGVEDSYSASNASTQVFDMAFLKIDSDQAFDTAQKHGGDKILEKDPNTPVFYICDWNHNTNALVWHVIYGTSRDDAKLTVSLNASTGEFIRVEK
ncbi:MAG TPA: hypothetical protein VMX38_13180 [Verrucomicrobiae bacterium]|nr:hypothetical protein [Verrucomicrobiae bacterium]